MLIDANFKLLLIRFHKNDIDTGLGGTYSKLYNTDIYNGDGFKIPAVIPFPLEINVNGYNLDGLSSIPLVNAGSVVSGVSQSTTLRSTQTTASTSSQTTADSKSTTAKAGVPQNDTTTKSQTVVNQHPSGKQLNITITFEIESVMPFLLNSYLEGASNRVARFTFTYISPTLVSTDLILGSFNFDDSEPNKVISITFLSPADPSTGLTKQNNQKSFGANNAKSLSTVG